ncbi:MAG: alpha/beta fold hydrolase [Methanoregula sp.]|uniref:alpha/beta fold hydrolase n=1 Tax=Methanoregula sp. TaxID=2052170 RepID=UPI003C4B0FDB
MSTAKRAERYKGIVGMATYILVHGGNMSTDTWNRLTGRHDYPDGCRLGAKYWDGTIAILKEHGHRAFAPTLADEHTHNLTDHSEQVCTLIETQDLRDLILVGHSYGGMVITGVADRMAGEDKAPRVP